MTPGKLLKIVAAVLYGGLGLLLAYWSATSAYLNFGRQRTLEIAVPQNDMSTGDSRTRVLLLIRESQSGTLPITDLELSGPWDGYHDGRLNPTPQDPYSVWCRDGQVIVFGSQPAHELTRFS